MITTAARRGAEVFAVELQEALCDRGRRVETVALVPGGQPSGNLDLPVLGHRRLGASALRRLRRAARGAGIVVGHGSTTLPACAIATIGTGVPFVYRNVGDPSFWGTTVGRRARVRTFLSRASAVVALTEESAAELVERYGVAATKITVIPKGVDARRFPAVTTARREKARARFGIPTDAAVVASVGALSPEKNVAAAIRAIGDAPELRLLIAGGGPEHDDLSRLASRVAPGRVQLLGQVDDPTPVYAAANALVVSSRTEGLPGVLMEAGLSGLPAVTTDVGYVRAIVRDGETGAVVPAGDDAALREAIRAVLEQPGLGTAARAHCLTHFDVREIAKKWDELLAGLEATG